MPAGCDLCGAGGSTRLYALPSGAIVRCTGCRTVRRERLISGDAAVELYEDDRYLDTPYFEALKVGAPRDVEPYLVYGRALELLDRRLPKGRLLDVGASYGAFLELAAEHGWEAHGVELSEKACAYAASERGLTMHHGTLAEASYPDGHFSAITLWDLIEHLDKPREFLVEARRILAPHGLLLVFTINQKSLINRVGHLLHAASAGAITRPLVLLYDIHHNFFFDRDTLTSLLLASGFAGDVEVEYMDAEIDRWQNVPIPPVLAFGSKCLDAVARLIGGRYRMMVLVSTARAASGGS